LLQRISAVQDGQATNGDDLPHNCYPSAFQNIFPALKRSCNTGVISTLWFQPLFDLLLLAAIFHRENSNLWQYVLRLYSELERLRSPDSRADAESGHEDSFQTDAAWA
jgi:hypothetical protein